MNKQAALDTEHFAQWNQALAEIISGTGDEPVSILLGALERIAGLSSSLVIVYSPGKKPEIPFDRLSSKEERAVHIDRYIDAAYLLDPFYRLSMDTREEGLYTLRDIAPSGYEDTEFYRIYYQHLDIDMDNEACYIVQLAGGAAINISAGRQHDQAPLGSSERQLLDVLFPVVKSILNRWWEQQGDVQRLPGIDSHLDMAFTYFGTSVLTEREAEILHLILRGYSVKSIAERLGNSLETVKHHRKSIYSKLDINTQAELFYLFIDSLRQPNLQPDRDPLIQYTSPPE